MEMIKCRTCLKLSNKDDCLNVESRCYLEQSVKQAILRLVPEMVLTIDDDDVVCRKCLRTLKICVKFIKTCLTVETILGRKLFYLTPEEMNTEHLMNIVETGDICAQIDSDHNYYIKQEIEDYNSINSNEDSENEEESKQIALNSLIKSRELHETGNSFSPILQTLLEEPLLLVKSNSENMILEISDSPEDSGTVKTKTDDIENDTCNFECSVCSTKFYDGEKYELHMESHILPCQFCDKTFSSENEYHNHASEHKETLIKICEYCGKTLKGARSLKMHITALHELSSPHICDRCPKSFKHKYKVNLHVKEVHDKARQQQCPACGKLFVNSERCKSHYKLVHLKLKPYVCPICGNKYGRKDYLNKHVADHCGLSKTGGRKLTKLPKHGIRLKSPGKPVACKICGREIASVHLLKAHLESHVKIKRYKCKYCELTFSGPTNRTRHEKIHENDSENKFRCNICWKRMKTEEELNEHINSHDRPPQYSCDICGDKFHRRYLLETHNAEKHTSMEDIEKAMEEIVVKNLLEYADPNRK